MKILLTSRELQAFKIERGLKSALVVKFANAELNGILFLYSTCSHFSECCFQSRPLTGSDDYT